MTPPLPDCPDLKGCGCFPPEYAGACVCCPTEKAIRAWASPTWHLDPMTEEQRAWCLAEIRAVEGWDDYQLPVKDSVLAADVLSAWNEYVQDKGLRP